MHAFWKIFNTYIVPIVAFLALFQRLIRFLFRKTFIKGRLDSYPVGNIDIGYSYFGPSIGLHGTLRCFNREFFIYLIDLEVLKLKDGSKHIFEWSAFRTQSITLAGEKLEIRLPYGFMLNKLQSMAYNILFVDKDSRDEIGKALVKVAQQWNKKAIKIPIKKDMNEWNRRIWKEYFDKFVNTSVYRRAHQKLIQLCYWTPGEYIIKLKIHTTERKDAIVKQWRFHLPEDCEEDFGTNVNEMLKSRCRIPPFQEHYYVVYVNYENMDSPSNSRNN